MTFEYKVETPDGEHHSLLLKPMSEVPIGIMRKHRHNDEEQMFLTLEWALEPEQLDILDRLPLKQLQAIVQAWQLADEVELGESEASSD